MCALLSGKVKRRPSSSTPAASASRSDRGTVIALAGNPNSGKTSLFNFITGSRQRVGNYAGVTVEAKEGTVRVDDALVTFLDLPGTYSLSPYSPEEAVAMREIVSDRVDAIIVVVDTTNLARNLYLASQIIETGKPVVIALNMYDEFEASGSELDRECLSQVLGVPCVRTVGNRGKGVTTLMATALAASRGEIPAIGMTPRYSHEVEHAVEAVEAILRGRSTINERWAAVTLLQFPPDGRELPFVFPLTDEDKEVIARSRASLEQIEGRDAESAIIAGRHGYASGAVAECLTERHRPGISPSERIDAVVTHRWIGIPLFLIVLWAVFQATFILGEPPKLLLQSGFDAIQHFAELLLPPSILRSLITDGIIAGVGGIVSFLPNVLLLFLFISFLEDTGYMARAAFIMDRLMHAVGLHGRSFIPMLVGFGCTVPAIMATRTIEHRRDRLVTMFIIPFMSCGARVPVYILLAGAFFAPHLAGTVIFSLYIVGVLLGLVVAKIVALVSPPSAPFVMELPPYRMPTLRSIALHIGERAWMYLRKAGTVILAFSILMWAAMTIPWPVTTPSPSPVPSAEINVSDVTVQNDVLAQSIAGHFGRFIEPGLKPLGFDWRIGVALTAGFAAKEVVVTTLASLYAIETSTGSHEGLIEALRHDSRLNPITGYALMLFILIYTPCFAVLGVVRREAGGWGWVALMVVYTIGLAWLVSFGFVTVARLFV